jgi:hypothetical protein
VALPFHRKTSYGRSTSRPTLLLEVPRTAAMRGWNPKKAADGRGLRGRTSASSAAQGEECAGWIHIGRTVAALWWRIW